MAKNIQNFTELKIANLKHGPKTQNSKFATALLLVVQVQRAAAGLETEALWGLRLAAKDVHPTARGRSQEADDKKTPDPKRIGTVATKWLADFFFVIQQGCV